MPCCIKYFKNIYYTLGLLENKSKSPHKVRTYIWSQNDKLLVLKVRKKYKLWGKYKIAAILKRKY